MDKPIPEQREEDKLSIKVDRFDDLWDETVAEVANMTPEELEQQLRMFGLSPDSIGTMGAKLAVAARKRMQAQADVDLKEIERKLTAKLQETESGPQIESQLTLASARPMGHPPQPTEQEQVQGLAEAGALGGLKTLTNMRVRNKKPFRPPGLRG